MSTTGDTGASRSTADTGDATVDTCPWTGAWRLGDEAYCGAFVMDPGGTVTMMLEPDGVGCSGTVHVVYDDPELGEAWTQLQATPTGVGDLVDVLWSLSWVYGTRDGSATVPWSYDGTTLTTDYLELEDGPVELGCTTSGGLLSWRLTE